MTAFSCDSIQTVQNFYGDLENHFTILLQRRAKQATSKRRKIYFTKVHWPYVNVYIILSSPHNLMILIQGKKSLVCENFNFPFISIIFYQNER
jgi:hypothetical protein